MDLDIVQEDPQWEDVDLVTLAQAAVTATLQRVSLDPDLAELSLLACNDARIAILNEEFRGKPTPTNVLSWPAQTVAPPDLPKLDFDGTCALGDLALAFETCAREAADQKKPLQDHVTHLIVHGVLHLLGYDHESDIDATLMEGIEVEILGKLGVDDPYS